MTKRLLLLVVFTLGLVFTNTDYSAFAKNSDDNKKSEEKEENGDKKNGKIKNISTITKKCTKHEGLFTIYQDTLNGSLYLQIEKEKLGKEFIYFGHAENGIIAMNMFKGAYREVSIFKPERYFNRIEFIIPNTNFYFDPENPISKAADANISDAVIYSAEIKAASHDGDTLIIKADDLFMGETMAKIKHKVSRNVYQAGGLAKDKTKITAIKNYSDNTDVITEYVYYTNSPEKPAGPVLADQKSVSIVFQHSFVAMPENKYEPRKDDPRIGYFTTQVNDMTANSNAPYKDIIHRWNLVKKNPEAELSEPVKPITFWIDNATPYEFRDAVKVGILNWNKAFEKIGFKNAVVAKQMPDDAEWEAGDINYNVIRWTATPNPRFAGYGPRFFNPRTGEILGSDVMIEYAQVRSKLRYADMFNADFSEVLNYEEDLELSEDELMAQNYEFAKIFAADGNESNDILQQYFIGLITHEVGHSLGLTHNFKASYFLSPEELQDKEITGKYGTTASIMEYSLINISPNKEKQGHYFSTTVGPYDIWAIEYGYKPNLSCEDLDAIADRSTEKGHIFGNDAENMRNLSTGMDPRVLTHDMSNDPIRYSTERLDLIIKLINELPQKYANEGTYHDLRYEFSLLLGQYKNAVATIGRYVGGIYSERVMADQEGGKTPFKAVPKETQLRAMKALHKYVFDKEALQFPAYIYQHAQYQRRGFNVGRDILPAHNIVYGIQREAIRPLLNPVMFIRMEDAKQYGSDYTIDEYLTDLSEIIFDYNFDKEITTQQQRVQTLYIKQLMRMFRADFRMRNLYPYTARALAVGELEFLLKKLNYKGKDKLTKGHQKQIKELIEVAFSFM